MKMLPAPLFAVLLLTGRAVRTINVLEKKDTPKPFTNILAVYVDGDMDFSVFDSTTYNISIRPRYKRMDKFCLTFITHHLRFFNCPFQLTVKNY
jgi:hypothetical protein